MFKRRKRHPTLLGEAFAMRESNGWEGVADNIRLQETIARKRRRVFIVLLLIVVAALLAIFAVMIAR